ncbi:sigma-70 family RNA polymerase sigma factor [Paraliobacillus salinarum]|uniref:sigma-70 family RNA polymerase sigma factor n=1 Tax=Paraliobacillus salinarum TaxID=1158996 RepID=UPI0015F416A4|nr:sigma-70 family RNA polymerase sigma factor [Paraliobacillus salinarum]
MIHLVKKAQKGNDKAFLTLFKKYEQDIYRMAYIYVKNQNDALDVVQETAYRSFKTIESLKEPKYFKTWLMRIVINCSLDFLRKQKKVVPLETELVLNVPDDRNELIDLSLTLRDVIELLDEREKSIIILRFYEGLTFQEIAKTLEIPLGTVKTISYRGLDKLRDNLKGDGFYG